MGKSSKQRRAKPKKSLYAIGLGSNRPLSRALTPVAIIAAAMRALDRKPLRLCAAAPLFRSRPIGPSARDYANSAAIIRTRLQPDALLRHLQAVERRFGRRRQQRWGARTLDLDILLWEKGPHQSSALTIPHPHYARRDFVLHPLGIIAPRWRDPATGFQVAHLRARLDRPKAVDPTRSNR